MAHVVDHAATVYFGKSVPWSLNEVVGGTLVCVV